MVRIVNKARNHRDAAKWDVIQQITMTLEQRQKVAKELKRRFYGTRVPDVRSKKT